jgi:hypothetical protein
LRVFWIGRLLGLISVRCGQLFHVELKMNRYLCGIILIRFLWIVFIEINKI